MIRKTSQEELQKLINRYKDEQRIRLHNAKFIFGEIDLRNLPISIITLKLLTYGELTPNMTYFL
jgi:hypothetical protein